MIEYITKYRSFQADVSDALPKFICSVCFNKIVDFHEFHTKIHNAQKKYLKNRRIKSNVDSVNILDTHEFNVSSVNIKSEPMDWIIPQFGNTSPAPESPTNDDSNSDNTDQSDRHGQLEKETIATVIAEYFDPTCELCPMELNSLQRAIEHYKVDHKINGGFLKCCGRKIRTVESMENHIRMHLEANDEPELIPMETTKKPSKSFQLKKANKITKKGLQKSKKRAHLLGNKYVSQRMESGLNEDNPMKATARKRCFICQSNHKRDRKVQTMCQSCRKHTCSEHAVHTLKCFDCIHLKNLPSLGTSLTTDNIRKRCVFCPSKLSRKVRKVCICCRRYTCNEHAVVSNKCTGCAISD